MVGTGNTNSNGPSDAAVVLAKPTNKGLALTTDCNSRYVYADPYKGTMIAVSEAARNIVCSGGQPLGITNCLNFGNPYDPEVYYQFVHAIKGMGEACRAFDTPVTGGNVSFYNQNPDGAVYPTPTIGMVGVLENMNNKMTLGFRNAGDKIYLVGQSRDDLNSSEYLHKICGIEFSPAPYFDLKEEQALQDVIATLIKTHHIVSAHDTSEGGLIVTLLESAFVNNLGFSVTASKQDIRRDAFWFGEAQSRVVVSVSSSQEAEFLKALGSHPYELLGKVTTGDILVDKESWGTIEDWKDLYDNAIHNLLAGHESEYALSAL
jgi:phosphoribosylformylglycinamidine synthase